MKSLLFMTILFSLTGFGADIKAPKEPMPKCVRPMDFANGKFVSSYEACLKRQENFCSSHKENKECLALPPITVKPYFKITTDDIDPSKRCKIEKDDSYKCLQDPIRIIVAEEPKAVPVAPATTPSGTPASDQKVLAVPTEDGTGDEKNPPVVLPPPPPHPH
jgi:hypothetical protein